jgi:hypothetical protein
MSLVEKQPKELQMTISSPRSPPLAAPDQPTVDPNEPLLRTVEFADDGCEGTGPATVDDFIVDWQLGVAAGARP